MYSAYKNITIYKKQFDIEWKNGDYIHMELDQDFLPTPDMSDQKWADKSGRYGVSFESVWIVVFDRKLKKYHRIFCPREVCNIIRKFSEERNVPFELQYCKHLFWKYDKHSINVIFADHIENEAEVDTWMREVIAPEHSTGTENQPIAVIYHSASLSYYAVILKGNRIVDKVHIPMAKGK